MPLRSRMGEGLGTHFRDTVKEMIMHELGEVYSPEEKPEDLSEASLERVLEEMKARAKDKGIVIGLHPSYFVLKAPDETP